MDMDYEDSVDGVVGNALTPGPGIHAIQAGVHQFADQYAYQRYMAKYFEAKNQGPVQWLLDANGQHVLDGNGTPMWIPAPNPMVVAAQDTLEWTWKWYQIKTILGGIICLIGFAACIYWSF